MTRTTGTTDDLSRHAGCENELAVNSAPPRPHILVVDDDPDVRSLLHSLATSEGYEVTTAADGADAIAAIRQRRPDVILLDLMMPVIDGWSFLDLYRQLPGPHAPVIVITAAAREARNAVSHSVGEVVPKPFSVDKVLALVHRYTGREKS